MCKTNLKDYLKSLIMLSTLSQTSSRDMGHLPNIQRYLGHTSEPLTPTQIIKKLEGGWVVAYVILVSPPVRIGLLDFGLLWDWV